MSDPLDDADFNPNTKNMGVAPRVIREAFDQWWEENKNTIDLDRMTEHDIKNAKAITYSAMIAGLSWSMSVPPSVSVHEWAQIIADVHTGSEQQRLSE